MVRLWASCPVSIRSDVRASPEKACTTSYGEDVRVVGISAPSGSCPGPAGSRERNIAPSRVLTLIAARVSVPKSAPSWIRKATFTWSPSSDTESTLPTRTPAMRTSSSAFSPPASLKSA